MSERQVIGPDGNFLGGLDVTSVSAAARNYRIVAVVGCQSGGKSTLLNATFGTTFPVLNAPKSGRRRTTLGVWGAVSRPQESGRSGGRRAQQPPVVVLDVEGSDSRERGDGAKAFESRTALFSLALADVVVVNMWAHDIGRYSAANYELFETVFAHAANLRRQGKVFTDARPVHILMVVRDHDGESAVSDIRRVLMGDMENIWESLRIRDVSFDVLFRVDVVTLPHKIYSPQQFNLAVKEFALRFAQPVKAPQPVPIVGFESLASSVWDAVCACTGGDGEETEFTLDIPQHAALAVHFSCGEIIVKLLDGQIGDRIEAMRIEIESEWRHPMRDFGARSDSIVRDALAAYDKDVSPYKSVDKTVCSRRRDELIVALAERLTVVSDRYLSTCRDMCLNGFEDEFRPLLGGTSGFSRESRRLIKRFTSQYKDLVDGGHLPPSLRPYLAKRAEAKRERQASNERRSNGGGRRTDGSPGPASAPDEGATLADSDEEADGELFTVASFKKELQSRVEERRRLGDLLLPGGAVGANMLVPGTPKKTPWWKGILIRGAVLAVNYLQAAHAHRSAMKVHREHEEEFPPGPTF